jgi:hypothetical protein
MARKTRRKDDPDDPYGYAVWIPTALIDPPYGGTLEDWLSFREGLRGMEKVAPVLREANTHIARLRRRLRRQAR